MNTSSATNQSKYFVGMADWQLERLYERALEDLEMLTRQERNTLPVHPALRLKGQIQAELEERGKRRI